MKLRYRMFRRRNGCFFLEDSVTRKQESLRTKNKAQASALLAERNKAHENPELCRHMAKTWLAAASPGLANRTWEDVVEQIIKSKTGETAVRWQRAWKDCALNSLSKLKLMETSAEHFLSVLEKGTVSTNVFLRRMQNFALDMGWLLASVLPKRQWPAVRYKEKRAITWEEHLQIIDREGNAERKAFYELLWDLGGSQGDIARLHAKDIDWEERVVCFERQKMRTRGGAPVQISFGSYVEGILQKLPKSGPLFPYLAQVRASDRATEFKQRCRGLGIEGVTLHSYRYAWAERAKRAGMSERYAMQALGHNSKAVHRAYARKVELRIPSIEELERGNQKVTGLPLRPKLKTLLDSERSKAA